MIKCYITQKRFCIKILRFAFYWLHFCCFNNFVINISQHIENPGIVRTVYSCIFRPIQSHSAIFSHVKAYWGTLRHTEAYLGIIEAYGAIIKIFGTLRDPCMYNCALFRTLAYLEAKASLKSCQTCKMIMHV